MKKQMKIFLLLFLLTGCMNAPQRAFQIDPDTEIYNVQVGEVETISTASHYDDLPHVENKMPATPEEAILEWEQKHLKGVSSNRKKLQIIIEKAEMLKTDMPSGSFFKSDEENYTLNYKIKVQIRQDSEVIQSISVEGKGFITLAKRVALSVKEKGWAWLIQKMLTHLKTKMKTDLSNVFVE